MGKETTAYHEAGHAVMAYHRGLPMLGADILETEERRGAVHMDEYLKHWEADSYGVSMKAWYLGQIMMGMAGVKAVEIFTGRPLDQTDPNLRQDGGSDWETLGVLAGELSNGDLQKAHDETERILLDNWHVVDAVAMALLEHKSLEKPMLHNVLEAGCSRDAEAVKEVENAYLEAEYDELIEERHKLFDAVHSAFAQGVSEDEILGLQRELWQKDQRIVELGGESWLEGDDG